MGQQLGGICHDSRVIMHEHPLHGPQPSNDCMNVSVVQLLTGLPWTYPFMICLHPATCASLMHRQPLSRSWRMVSAECFTPASSLQASGRQGNRLWCNVGLCDLASCHGVHSTQPEAKLSCIVAPALS